MKDVFNYIDSLKISKQFEFASSSTKMFPSQDWLKKYTGLGVNHALLKAMTPPYISQLKEISQVGALAHAMAFQTKINIPSSFRDSLNAINKQNQLLLGGLTHFQELSKSINTFSQITQINSIKSSLAFTSAQFASSALLQQKWDLLENYDEITNEFNEINESIIEENGISFEIFNRLNQFFQRIEFNFDKADTEAIVWKLLNIICIYLTIVNEIRYWTPKIENATNTNTQYVSKQEVEQLLNKQLQSFQLILKQKKEYRITTYACKVFSKPKSKSLIIEKIPADFELVVLQVNHKWAYVSYNSLNDNYPVTGWVMKKYLSRP